MPKTQPYESNCNTGANNFLQVIYSLNSQFSYDVTRNYLNYYCYYYLEREHLSPHQIGDRSCNWYQLMLKITISIACIYYDQVTTNSFVFLQLKVSLTL